jgi:hypothetical protein
MDINTLILDDWPAVISMMPAGFEKSARDDKAIQRCRKVGDASTLLRLALIYAMVGGLRVTSALAAKQGITDISDVALLKRLCEASTWLANLASKLLTDRMQFDADRCRIPRRIRCVDATCVKRPGSVGTDYRVHVGFSLAESRIDHVEITDASGGETLKRIPVEPGDILVGDRGYSHANGISDAVTAGADVIVRLNWYNLPLTDLEGATFNIIERLHGLPVGAIGEWSVSTVAKPAQEVQAVQARLVAIRKTEASAEAARRKLRADARKKGRTPSAQSLEYAGFIVILTTVSAEEMSAEQCLEIYRFRWQIELAFKNLKSVFGLSSMAAKSSRLCIAFISAILIAAILIDRMTTKHVFFSPWGYATPGNNLCGEGSQTTATMSYIDPSWVHDRREDDGQHLDEPTVSLRSTTKEAETAGRSLQNTLRQGETTLS